MDYMAMMSAYKFVKPERIIIHTYTDIVGKYWELTQNWSNISVQMNKVGRIDKLSGKHVDYIEHHADYLKLSGLLEFGGVVSDFDVIIVNGTKLRHMHRISECVLSQERDLLNIGFESCVRNSPFIRAWLDGYDKDYRSDSWSFNGAVYSRNILEKNRSTCYNVYVVNGIASDPMYYQYSFWLKKGGVKWKYKVAAHYFNKELKKLNESVLDADHALGEMLRFVVKA